MAIPRVLAIGSCRIARPLRVLHKRGEIDLLNMHSHTWFTHSSGEAAQYVRVLAGEKKIPTDLRPLVCETVLELPDDLAAPHMLVVDVAVVEVATVRTFAMHSVRLNFHRTLKLAKEKGVTAGELEGVTTGRTTQDELLADIATIRRLTGATIVLVDHLWWLTEDGSPIRAREALTELLISTGQRVYSTRPLIETHGQDTALEDATHYRDAFHKLVAAEMLPEVLRATEDHRLASAEAR